VGAVENSPANPDHPRPNLFDRHLGTPGTESDKPCNGEQDRNGETAM
jgi:hypothetical protein